MAWSPYKDTIVSFVSKNPGCTKYEVADYITYRRNPTRSYFIVDTAIRHEWIYAYRNKNNTYSLFATEEEYDQYVNYIEDITHEVEPKLYA